MNYEKKNSGNEFHFATNERIENKELEKNIRCNQDIDTKPEFFT